MSTRDEIQALMTEAVSSSRVGKVFLEQGEAGFLEANFQLDELVALLPVILDAHRDALMLLADKIDALDS
jgi:hypothetical protein